MSIFDIRGQGERAAERMRSAEARLDINGVSYEKRDLEIAIDDLNTAVELLEELLSEDE